MRALHPVVVRRPLCRSAIATSLLAALCACTSPSPPPSSTAPSPAARPTADDRAAAPARLATERQWLSNWFKGTPVRIRQLDNSSIAIEVPREFCFDRGQTTVKPALGAVLDKTAQSLQRMPLANVSVIAAPADGQGGGAELALKRAAQVSERLRAAGVRAEQLAKPSPTDGAAVQLRIEASSL